MNQLDKTYDPSKIEDRIYERWIEKRYFHAEPDPAKKPFTIVIPPPNITGQLHMGHALDNTLQDILIRFKRMQGYNALWQPGTDHASIATEVKIIEKLKEEGIDKNDLGREGFLERAWAWKKEYGGRIISQLKKLGSSCDWERERFTMDEGCSKAVTEVFCRMHEKGWIYKGSRIINWCPVCNTSISDAEVEYQEKASHLWHIKYPLIEENGEVSTTTFLEFATTRPETMLGDTAVAVNPGDERYSQLVGRELMLPFVNRRIPIIADEYVDMEFGTGVVKITPAHDPNDFEVGKRHSLPEINIMNDDATINEAGGEFAGMSAADARRLIVERLDAMGLLVRVEDYTHNVGTHDRCGSTIEPLIKQQWFVKMDELIKPAAQAVRDGDIKLVPPRMDKLYFNWTDNIRDWCISRQLWWGHRIPAYTCADCGKLIVAGEMPDVCPDCGCTRFTQDEDTLDTWFSSALWPFSTLGWPDITEDLKYFYPTDVLVTGYDIIFFWVIRMIFSGFEHMKEKPFKTVFFHGLVRDANGLKMSKSLGNGIDPLEVIKDYGADALRLTLVTGNAPGNDMRFYYERVEAAKKFANKIWNATKFILMNMEGISVKEPSESELCAEDKWIISRCNTLSGDVTDNMDKFELGIAVSKVYDFIWDEFCDWYIEMVKPRLYGDSDPASKNAALHTLRTVLLDALRMLHPFMPFVTEELFMALQDEEESIMISKWPEYSESRSFAADEGSIDTIKAAIRGIRALRTEKNVPPSRKAQVFVVAKDPGVRDIFSKGEGFFKSLAGASELTVQADRTQVPKDALSCVITDATIFVPLSELVDIEKERERLTKERERLLRELERSEKMLSNEKFIAKAPRSKVDEEKEKQEGYRRMLEKVDESLSTL